MKTEELFKSCFKDHEKLKLVYSPKIGSDRITNKCFKEKLSATTTYTQIAKLHVIEKESLAIVEGKICNFE